MFAAPIEIILEPKYEPLERPEVPLTDSLKPIVVDMTASGELKWTDVEPDVFEAAAKPEVQLNDALRPIVIDMTGRGNDPNSSDDGKNSLRPEVVDLTSPGQDYTDDDDYTGLFFEHTLEHRLFILKLDRESFLGSDFGECFVINLLSGYWFV